MEKMKKKNEKYFFFFKDLYMCIFSDVELINN